MRRLLLVVVALLLVSVRGQATAVLGFRTAERVILAADSAVTSIQPDGSMRPNGTACKIERAGTWWFISGALDRAKGLSVSETIGPAIAEAPSLLAALTAIHREYQRAILPVLLRLDVYFTSQFAIDKPVIEVLVAGVEGGEPKIGLFTALLKGQRPRELVAGGLMCPGRFCDDDTPGQVLHGASMGGVIPDLLIQRPRPAWLRGDAAAARRLIEMQIARTPDYVKAPIDALELTAAGARWIERDPASACAIP